MISREVLERATEDEKREYLTLMAMKEQGMEDFPFEFYQPNQKPIAEFHRSPARQRMLWGGEGSGKSLACGMEVYQAITGNYMSSVPLERRLKTPTRGRIIVPDMNRGIGGIWEPMLDAWLPKGIILNKAKHGQSQNVEWRFKNGSSFHFMTHEQTVTQYAGWEGDWAAIDEPCPRYCFMGTYRGLRKKSGGQMWLTFTPDPRIPHVSWLEKELKKSRTEKNIECFFAETSMNPYVDKLWLEEYSKKMTPEEKIAKLKGKPITFLGRFFPIFDETVHKFPRRRFELHDAFRVMCIDHHSNRPDWALWLACLRDGEIVAEGELRIEGQGRRIKDVCDQILSKEAEICQYNGLTKWRGKRWIDNSALTKDEASGRKIISHYKDFIKDPSPVAVPQNYKSLFDWEVKMNELLYYEKDDKGNFLVQPKFYVFDNCPHLIEQFSEAVRDNFVRPRAREENEPKETLKDVNVCLLKNLKYMINNPSTRFQEYWEYDEDSEAGAYKPRSKTTGY